MYDDMQMWFFIIWFAFGILAAGWCFAYFQDEFCLIAKESRCEDYVASMLMLLAGPIGAITALIFGGFAKHGWRLWPKKTEAQ